RTGLWALASTTSYPTGHSTSARRFEYRGQEAVVGRLRARASTVEVATAVTRTLHSAQRSLCRRTTRRAPALTAGSAFAGATRPAISTPGRRRQSRLVSLWRPHPPAPPRRLHHRSSRCASSSWLHTGLPGGGSSLHGSRAI